VSRGNVATNRQVLRLPFLGNCSRGDKENAEQVPGCTERQTRFRQDRGSGPFPVLPGAPFAARRRGGWAL